MVIITAKYCAAFKQPTKLYLVDISPQWTPFKSNAMTFTEAQAKILLKAVEKKSLMKDVKIETTD